MKKIQNLRNWIIKHTGKSLIYVSIIIFSLDIFFVVINYYSNKSTLNHSLLQNAAEQQKEFGLTLQMTYRNMMQMALYISQNQELNQLFLQGRNAIINEGGSKGGEKANIARQQLLKKIKPAWDKLTKAFDIRQLHYHIGPGSLSFLRVHKPHKYGDRMDDLRFIIVDTNQKATPRYGFETGRIYSGLRGVYPIWATDPKSGKTVHVGALETGTSFKQILPEFAKFFETNIAILLTRSHIESKMWPEFIKTYFAKNPETNYYIEATSSKNVKDILANIKINSNLIANKIQLYKQNNRYWSIFYFPLRDYQGTTDKNLPPSGLVLTWTDVTHLINNFHKNIIINIIYALIAFLIVEIALVWFLVREKKLATAEEEATIDGLTKIANRRQFDRQYNKEYHTAKKLRIPLSLILCDIDFFKSYNDIYGHQAGDQCLIQVANTIKSNLKRNTDLVARYGGEEFVIILPNTTLDEAISMATHIKYAIYNLKIKCQKSAGSNFLSLSIGVACSENSLNKESLLKQADENLYEAKLKGRNRVEPEKA